MPMLRHDPRPTRDDLIGQAGDARVLIGRIEDSAPPHLRGLLTTARQLMGEFIEGMRDAEGWE
jgi:hypothetical protein